MFSITSDGHLFYDGEPIGTIAADPATINGRKFVTRGLTTEDHEGSFVKSMDIAASMNDRVRLPAPEVECHADRGEPCTCSNGIGCVHVPYVRW